MKTFLFSILAFVVLAMAAPVAEAGQFARVYTKHGPAYVHKSQFYGGNYYGGNYNYKKYRHHRHNHNRYYSRSYRSYPSYYSRPVYYSRPSYGYFRSDYGYRSRPRIAVSFGF